MRLTPEVVQQAPQTLNCLGDRELSLRARAIPRIENLALARDAFDTIDLSANMITVLGDGFPPFPRLRTLYLGSNRIERVVTGVADSLPNLRTLILSSNRIATLDDVNVPELARLRDLEVLCLLDNPVERVPDFRLFLISSLPTLRMLNFTKVAAAERTAAAKKFASSDADKKRIISNGDHDQAAAHKRKRRKLGTPSTEAVKTFVVGNMDDDDGDAEARNGAHDEAPPVLTEVQAAAVRALISKADSVDEVVRLQTALRDGSVLSLLTEDSAAAI